MMILWKTTCARKRWIWAISRRMKKTKPSIKEQQGIKVVVPDMTWTLQAQAEELKMESQWWVEGHRFQERAWKAKERALEATLQLLNSPKWTTQTQTQLLIWSLPKLSRNFTIPIQSFTDFEKWTEITNWHHPKLWKQFWKKKWNLANTQWRVMENLN